MSPSLATQLHRMREEEEKGRVGGEGGEGGRRDREVRLIPDNVHNRTGN